jgi:hypothetical protein
MKSSVWTKIKRERGLYRYEPSATYHARVRFRGKLHRKKLETADLQIAKRKLRAFKDDLERTDATKGNMSFAAVLREYVETLTGQDDALLDKYFNALSNGDDAALKLQAKTLMGDSATLRDKLAVVGKLVRTWFGVASLPAADREAKPGDEVVVAALRASECPLLQFRAERYPRGVRHGCCRQDHYGKPGKRNEVP